MEVLPGPSAPVTALVASGLPAARWLFVGFLPRKRAELTALLRAPAETLVAFESPRRLVATLALLAELEPARPVAVCRELTKLHEEVARGSAAELAARYARAGTAGRDRARDRGRPAGRGGARACASRRCVRWWRRARARARPPRPSRS